MKVVFSKSVIKDIRKLDHNVQRRIKKKLLWFADQENLFDFAETITDTKIGQYRFRVGDYRILFDVEENQTICIHAVGHRRDIYKLSTLLHNCSSAMISCV